MFLCPQQSSEGRCKTFATLQQSRADSDSTLTRPALVDALKNQYSSFTDDNDNQVIVTNNEASAAVFVQDKYSTLTMLGDPRQQ